MAIKTVLFDLDGTLLDTNDLIIKSFKHTYRRHLNRDMEDHEIIKNFGEILATTLERECPDCHNEALSTYREFQVENFDKLITIHTGVKEGIKTLHKKGYKLGIVTSRIYKSAVRGLNHFDLMDYFGCIITADATDKHKPDPTSAYMALDKLGGSSKETIFVGDSPYDVLCAKNAGMISVVVSWSALPREMYMEHGPDYVVDTMEELVELIERL